mgnify:CR=1 FL=1
MIVFLSNPTRFKCLANLLNIYHNKFQVTNRLVVMDCNDNTLPLFGLPKYSMLQSVWIKNSTGITKSGVTRELHPYQSCFPWLIAANDFKSFSYSNCKPTFGEHTLASPVGIAAPWYNIQEQMVNNTIVLFYFYFFIFIFISNGHDHLFSTHPDTKPPACDIGQQHLSTFLIGTGACFFFFIVPAVLWVPGMISVFSKL